MTTWYVQRTLETVQHTDNIPSLLPFLLLEERGRGRGEGGGVGRGAEIERRDEKSEIKLTLFRYKTTHE
jgi:hypothetical protein